MQEKSWGQQHHFAQNEISAITEATINCASEIEAENYVTFHDSSLIKTNDILELKVDQNSTNKTTH